MKILVTGATGYIGGAAAEALLARGHHVLALARSPRSADKLRDRGLEPVRGDFSDPASLKSAITHSRPDAIVSTASVGASRGDTAVTFARDRDAVRAMQQALATSGGALVFTSGSAVFGTFNDGHGTPAVFDEDSPVPLPKATFAPPESNVPAMLVSGFGAAMAARVETEQTVLADPNVRGIVMRPGLVFGRGGSLDIPSLIARARVRGRAGHWGPGETTQSFVHVDDLAELYCLAVESAPAGAILHATTDDITQRELARAVSRMLGAGDQADSLTLADMLEMDTATRLGLSVAGALPTSLRRSIASRLTPPPGVGSGISLVLNKRLSSEKTRRLTGWTPRRRDILDDIEHGSYAA
ncbi:NAD-dependent epimerase/dehydratase family protein [Streptomyces sp. NPDC056653]|uniref:NAD-dependent epimerase/dehydratase family protein n=1 Tax=Streptomyces sp. NPDC056653 TaxID=3345894 RepID=UPI0036AC7EC7